MVYHVPNVFILISAAGVEKKGFTVAYEDFPVKEKGEADFVKFLNHDDSDAYIFYTVNLAIETDLKALALVRRVKKEKPVIFFGPAPTFWPEKFLKDEYAYVVRGEPELSLAEFLEALRDKADFSRLEGISYYKDGKIFNNNPRPLIENLDTLPFPARDLLERDKYFNPKLRFKPFTIVFTSRGCSHRCIFCVPCSLNFATELEYKKHFQKKPPVRLRSAANVIEEFKLLKAQGYRAVSIWDDLFVWGKERTIEISRGIKDLGLAWGCQSRADHLDEEIIKEMAQAGCKYIDIGVESFCQEILDYVKKDLKVEQIKEVIELIKKYGISAKINVIFGASPLETKETIRQTQQEIGKLGVDQVMYNICNPFPGTDIYNLAKKEGWFIKGEYEPQDVAKTAIISLPHLSNLDLERFTKRANFKFFLRPSFIIKNIFKTGILRIGNLGASLKALMRKLF